MKKIALEFENSDRISYPVGEDMKNAVKYINDLIICFKQNSIFESVKEVTLWGRGSSGAILSALLSSKLIEIGITVRIVHVKKDGESSHGNSYNIIKEYDINSYNIIIDDFISYGDTVNAIYEKFINYNPGGVIDLLIVQTINTKECLNFVPKCVISDTKGLNKLK